MKIKVQCPCETRFEFEIEPVGGRMPMAINCPTCGADATDLANALIEQQSAEAPADIAPAQEFCPKHKSELAVETCRACGKPICLKCMEQFGYVCGAYCRQQATLRRIHVPVYAHQKSVAAGRSHVLAKRLTSAGVVVVMLLLGFWIWYAWFARNYKIVYTMPIPKRDLSAAGSFKPEEFYQLIGPGQLLSIKNQNLTVFDVAQQKQLWSAALPADPEATFATNPRVIATTNDIWVCFSHQLARFDRQTGAAKEVTIKDGILEVIPSDTAILVVSGTPDVHETLTEITLPDGAMQTEDITTSLQSDTANSTTPTPAYKSPQGRNTRPVETVNKLPIGQLKNLASFSASQRDAGQDAASVSFDNEHVPFFAAGPNVVQLNVQLLERKTIAHTAMKAKGKSILDSGTLTASQGMDVAQEMMNDARREQTGGVEEEDVSRYQVSLHRHFAPDIPDWTGEVTGPPRFFPLKTVDVLTAGQTIYVFDKRNKKLWEAKLTFSAAAHFPDQQAPCLETADALYFADLGMLTRYDLATGNVRWRFNSVGISRVQADRRGNLYVDTTTAGPESIQYSQQINVHDKIHPLLLKLDPATSKVLWRLESIGDHCLLSGKFVYATRVSSAFAALRLEEGPDIHYNLNLLDPANGNEIWNFHRGNQRLVKTEVQKNWIMVHFQDEVVVLKFFSL